MTRKRGFIILIISLLGIERKKLYHVGNKEDTAQMFALYEKISPDLIRLDAKIRNHAKAKL